MICQASDCALIIPMRALGFSNLALAQQLRMSRTVLNAVVDHLYVMAIDRSVEDKVELQQKE